MIRFENVTKAFKQGEVIKGLNFEIQDGEMVVLVGPSGCGKTTTLKMINKLTRPTSGRILIDDQDIARMDTVKLRRKIGYVIQKTGLFPHMTVKDNIEIILQIEGMNAEKRDHITSEMMRIVGMDPEAYLYRYPSQLSGGQLQRIGVARAFASDPKIVLMDEPFSALDPITRAQLQSELVGLQTRLKKTVVFVTHDMDEAIKIADRICILDEGRIIQYDTPENILKNPANDYISNFVGKKRIWNTPELIRVRDIMMANPVSCTPDTGLAECAELLGANEINAMPVTDSEKRLVGIAYGADVQKQADRTQPVGKIMKTEFPTTVPEKNLLEILAYIRERQLDFVPVVDGERRLIGLITSKNLMTVLSQQFVDTEGGR
ncbi:betaine/proline/choline family ABC transporter ATP-binding protein [Caproiciproducens sp. CPB-2]|uniref:betaine/proline/choline family ABC transporter ATP-binding protein n=1 Tax=Caproiciproducens sp. CPB-2 TaxID=3030017 RepID=UPI0023DC403A|nr:betaine/proline/choline family ABC transporter ATP-binding protein [Caproiciproducens sp. CPB-2]MDF1494216.1 betaine/proline/choline family ABC transporter ATP-binding protein [Caproiciproducens sp. CPB-2]